MLCPLFFSLYANSGKDSYNDEKASNSYDIDIDKFKTDVCAVCRCGDIKLV